MYYEREKKIKQMRYDKMEHTVCCCVETNTSIQSKAYQVHLKL